MAFDGMTEREAREEILGLVGEYCDKYHNQQTTFVPGERIPYAGRIYGREEMSNLVDASLEFWLTAGHWTAEFESGLASYLGVTNCALVGSGSQANHLAFSALTAPELGDRAIRRGDEVITVAAGFPTTVAPALQYGAVPVFVDVTIPQYNIDVEQLEAAYTPGKTKAVMIAHTLGNPFDLDAVKAFCDAHGLWLVEDNCDALGSEVFFGGKTRKTGTIGDIGTSSFYPPHHMTMGEGGAVYTSDPELSVIIRSMRDWGRDCRCASGQDNLCGHRFDGRHGQLPFGYDHKYVYSHFGYNLKATDLQAAIGCAQLKRLPGFVDERRRNWAILKEALVSAEDKLVMPEPLPGSNPSWFGFLMMCKGGVDRRKVVPAIEAAGVQTRMLFAGNITRHPCFDSIRDTDAYRVVGELSATDRIMNDAFWVGVYPGMTDAALEYMADAIAKALM